MTTLHISAITMGLKGWRPHNETSFALTSKGLISTTLTRWSHPDHGITLWSIPQENGDFRTEYAEGSVTHFLLQKCGFVEGEVE